MMNLLSLVTLPRRKRKAKANRLLAFQKMQNRVPVTRPVNEIQKAEAQRPRALSGRRPTSFQSSVTSLEFAMQEGDPHPEGGVYNRWGMRTAEKPEE
jgi:hypothetical protein